MPISIRVEHVNPFISSTMETFTKMVGIESKPGKLMLKKDAKLNYDISGIIGLSGMAKGTVAMSFPKETAIAVCNKFMSGDYKDLHPDILDAVGELVNIVAGNAKKELTEFNIAISLPSVITGPNHKIIEPKDAFSFVVPFDTNLGGFHLAVSLKPT
ncbi:MAG: chemotaxis protein CheX [Fibrobacteria bacterium]